MSGTLLTLNTGRRRKSTTIRSETKMASSDTMTSRMANSDSVNYQMPTVSLICTEMPVWRTRTISRSFFRSWKAKQRRSFRKFRRRKRIGKELSRFFVAAFIRLGNFCSLCNIDQERYARGFKARWTITFTTIKHRSRSISKGEASKDRMKFGWKPTPCS